jgi:hypothetical protein
MTLAGFQKSVRMFRKFSEETLRRRGTNQLGREGVAALVAIEAVLDGKRLFDGTLLEPLAAFTNLLQSAQLPPDFGDYGFGDALLAIEAAHAEQRQGAEQRWEFATELDAATAEALKDFRWTREAAASEGDREHGVKLRRSVLEAAHATSTGSVVVCGALATPELPLAELASRFQRVILNDLDLAQLEALVRRAVPEQHRERVKLERYDPTGSYAEFAAGVASTLQTASAAEAEQALAELVQSYDVGAASAGLTDSEAAPDLAVSAMLLSELGRGYAAHVRKAFEERGWDPSAPRRAPLQSALALLSRLVEQHHIHALLRRAKSAVLVSAVSQVTLRRLPNGQNAAEGEPDDLLSVEHLAERLPEAAQTKAEQSWEWQQALPQGVKNGSLLTLVEAVLV